MAFYGITEGRSLGAGEFLAVGEPCTRETVNVPASNAQAVTIDGNKILKAGTVFPTNNASAKGILYEDVDVTNGDAAGSLVTAGTVYEDRISIASTAKSALTGIKFVTRPTVTRP